MEDLSVQLDRRGTEVVPLFASGDPEMIRQTMWFYGYATSALKCCISMKSQNFSGLLELFCVAGGPITTVEAQEMPQILADALHDASLSEVEIRCEYKITTISYREFLQTY